MKFEGSFTSSRAYILGYNMVYGTAVCKYKNEKLKVILTYQGNYNYNNSAEIEMHKLESNQYNGHFLLGIKDDEIIYAGNYNNQIFAIHFDSKYENLAEIEIGKKLKGQYISINPGDKGEIKFKRTK